MREVWKLSFILILVLFVAHAPKIFFGLGLADSGHHIARQQELILFGDVRGSAAVTLLSDVFGGLWLKLTGNASMLWVRIGGALLNCLNGLIVFLILKDYFPIRKAFASVLISAIMIVLISPYQLFINYYSVPAFIITLAIYLLHKALSCQNNLIEKFCIYGVGVLLFAVSAARVPLIVLPIMALISVSVAYFVTAEESRNKTLHIGLLLFAGILTGASVFWYSLSLQGLWKTYLESIHLAFSSSPLNDVAEYSFSTLFPMYLNRGIKAVILAGFGTFFLMLINRYRFGSSSISLYILTMLAGIALLFAKSNGPIQGLLRFREILLGFIVICCAIVLFNERKRNGKFCLLFVSATLSTYTMALGSTLGLQTAVHGMWFSLPSSVLTLTWLHESRGYPKLLSLWQMYKPATVTQLLIVCVIVFMPRSFSWNYSPNLIPAIMQHKAAYQFPKLKGIFDEPGKVRIVDSIATTLVEVTKRGDKCLYFNHIGLFYWLSETRSYFDSPVMYHSRSEILEAQLKKAISSGMLPAVCLFHNFGLKGSAGRKEIERDITLLKQFFINEKGYKPIMKAGGFEIYENPEPRRLSRLP